MKTSIDVRTSRLRELFASGRDNYERKIKDRFPDISPVMDGSAPIAIFGAARLGRIFLDGLTNRGIRVVAFADNNPALWGTTISRVPVLSPEELRRDHASHPVLIASLLYETEIYDSLMAMRFPLIYPLSFLHHARPDVFPSAEYDDAFTSLFTRDNQARIIALAGEWVDEISFDTFIGLLKFRLTLEKKIIRDLRSPHAQYFEPGLISMGKDEVFLDCGAYTGDTVTQFVRETSGAFTKVYAFEPDRGTFLTLQSRVSALDPSRIVPLNLGICESSGTRGFDESGTIDTRMGDGEGAVCLPVVSIDDFMREREAATFIKMDIEGGEMGALTGARETILRQKPKLAVAVYHRACDLWQIPLFIKQLNSGYKLYLRHYTNEPVDTVCYAV